MRILAFSDVRVQPVSVMEAVAQEVQPDLILYAGDDVGRFAPGPNNWEKLAKMARYGIAGVLGNDCEPNDAQVFKQNGCHNLGDNPIIVEGLGILGLPGAPKDEAGGLGTLLYTKTQAEEHLKQQQSQVVAHPILLVSHTPPQGYLDSALRFGFRAIGSSAVRIFVEQNMPKAVICGHAHLCGGRSCYVNQTLVVNIASHDELDAPLRYVVLDWVDSKLKIISFGERNLYSDLMRIWGIGIGYAEAFLRQGLTTLEDVWNQPIVVEKCLGLKRATHVRAQARAVLTGKPVLLEPTARFPKSVVYLDIETSLERSDDPWLIGVYDTCREDEQQLIELDHKKHREHLIKLDEYFQERNPNMIARWGSRDQHALTQAFKHHNLSLPPWLEKKRWIDLNSWVIRVLRLPLTSYGLKPVATHLGYQFAHPELDGITVGGWYSRYRASKQVFNVDKVKDYNRDDVMSMVYIVEQVHRLLQENSEVIQNFKNVDVSVDQYAVEKGIAKYSASLQSRLEQGELTQTQVNQALNNYAQKMRKGGPKNP